jgi:hypothetical protein
VKKEKGLACSAMGVQTDCAYRETRKGAAETTETSGPAVSQSVSQAKQRFFDEQKAMVGVQMVGEFFLNLMFLSATIISTGGVY